MVQVSNNPYGRTVGTLTSRPRLDSGRLGVIALRLPEGRPDPAALAAVAAGRPDRLRGFAGWDAPAFEVDSGDLVDAGVDGEALRQAPPLRFTIRPSALRVRLPRHASGLSSAAREQRARARLRGLLESPRPAAVRPYLRYWSLELLSGVLISLLGLWVSVSDRVFGLAGRTAFILLWVGLMALFRGVSDIVLAFNMLGRRARRG
ncbi:MAG: hypothetical protein ACJ73E_08350 [Mycobacteriales bacterium]